MPVASHEEGNGMNVRELQGNEPLKQQLSTMAAATACKITASLMRTALARVISRSGPTPSVTALR